MKDKEHLLKIVKKWDSGLFSENSLTEWSRRCESVTIAPVSAPIPATNTVTASTTGYTSNTATAEWPGSANKSLSPLPPLPPSDVSPNTSRYRSGSGSHDYSHTHNYSSGNTSAGYSNSHSHGYSSNQYNNRNDSYCSNALSPSNSYSHSHSQSHYSDYRDHRGDDYRGHGNRDHSNRYDDYRGDGYRGHSSGNSHNYNSHSSSSSHGYSHSSGGRYDRDGHGYSGGRFDRDSYGGYVSHRGSNSRSPPRSNASNVAYVPHSGSKPPPPPVPPPPPGPPPPHATSASTTGANTSSDSIPAYILPPRVERQESHDYSDVIDYRTARLHACFTFCRKVCFHSLNNSHSAQDQIYWRVYTVTAFYLLHCIVKDMTERGETGWDEMAVVLAAVYLAGKAEGIFLKTDRLRTIAQKYVNEVFGEGNLPDDNNVSYLCVDMYCV